MTAAPPITRIAHADVTRDQDLTTEEVSAVLALAAEVKKSPERYRTALAGKSIAMLFEKPSLRTRITFELAIQELGGFAVNYDGPIGAREPLRDMARNLDRWVHAIVARTFRQQTVDDMADWAEVPVINALSDMYHPCQALADMQTLQERFGSVKGLKLAFIGDGNNVAHSLMLNAAQLGMDFALATPERYEASQAIIDEVHAINARLGGKLVVTTDPAVAAAGAQAIYTDVWASMGEEDEAAERRTAFAEYQIDEGLFKMAAPNAVFMHCLPARRGEEVTDGVIESPRSVVFDQAENRLHAQKALLLMLMS